MYYQLYVGGQEYVFMFEVVVYVVGDGVVVVQ